MTQEVRGAESRFEPLVAFSMMLAAMDAGAWDDVARLHAELLAAGWRISIPRGRSRRGRAGTGAR